MIGNLRQHLANLLATRASGETPEAMRQKRTYSERFHVEQRRARWGLEDTDLLEEEKSGGVQPKATGLWALLARNPRIIRNGVLLATPFLILAILAIALLAEPFNPFGQPPASPIAPPDPLADLPASLRSELVAPGTQLPARLKLTFTGKPEDLCAELNALGMENNGWRRAPFQRSRWQCASDLVDLTTASVDYGPATLFFLLRGPQETKIDYLRLKLNVEDPKQMQLGRDAMRQVIGELSERYAWAVPEPFFEAINSSKPLEMIDRGVRLSVAPDDPELTGDPAARQRLNVILDFGEPDLIRSPDGFERLPKQRRALKSPAAE